jgi:hypothetical protein
VEERRGSSCASTRRITLGEDVERLPDPHGPIGATILSERTGVEIAHELQTALTDVDAEIKRAPLDERPARGSRFTLWLSNRLNDRYRHGLDLGNSDDFGLRNRASDRLRAHLGLCLMEGSPGLINDATLPCSIADDTPGLSIARDRARDHIARNGTGGITKTGGGSGVRGPMCGDDCNEESDGESNAEDK